MFLKCSDRDSVVSLNLQNDEPLVLTISPFVGSLQIVIDIVDKKPVNILCCHLHHETESFTIPRCTTSFEEVPPQSYFVLTRDAESYTVFFCLSHHNIIASLAGHSHGLSLSLNAGTSCEPDELRNVLLCLRGKKLHDIIQRAMKIALQLTGGMGKLLRDKLAPPMWLDGLGWESGVSLGQQVSHASIVECVSSLLHAGLQLEFVLIDEGWQDLSPEPGVDGSKPALASFGANAERFPRGIKGIIEELKKLGVKHVGVWHGMMGYRGGIHPMLANAYDLPYSGDGRRFLGYDLGRTFQFYYDYYGYLRDQGVTFIKVGDQSSVNGYCTPGMDPTLFYKNLQAAMQAAASIQFNSAHFNTECLRNENLFYWGNSRIARAAEDIDVINPLGMMRAIRNNLTNSLWLQHLMQPDFDAWLTNADQSETLAIFHALSGSINVIGDPAGEHNKSLIHKFLMLNGRLLKADRPLTLCEDSIFCNPLEEKKIYKAFTFKGHHGIVAIFNLTSGKRTLHGQVSSNDIDGLHGDAFAVMSYLNGFIKVVRAGESLSITLKPNQSDVFTFAPVNQGIAVLGCHSFFLAPGPITEVHIEEDAMHISSMVASPLLVYCERQILEVRRNAASIPWEYDIKRKILSIDTRASSAATPSLYTIAFEA